MNQHVNPETFTEKRKTFEWKWFGVELLSGVQANLLFTLANYGISSLSSALHWAEHRSYINRFFKEKDHESWVTVWMTST